MHLAIVIALSLAFPQKAEPSFGVTPEKIGVAPIYRLNGRPVPAHIAYDAIDKGLDDDGRKLRVTIIGSSSSRSKARRDLESHPAFADLRPRLALRDFAPEHWALKPGFVTAGQPTIYLQTPEGKVLHRQDDFAGGADALIAALRKANAAYDPRRDPDLRPRIFNVVQLLSIAIAGVIGAAASAIVRRLRSVHY